MKPDSLIPPQPPAHNVAPLPTVEELRATAEEFRFHAANSGKTIRDFAPFTMQGFEKSIRDVAKKMLAHEERAIWALEQCAARMQAEQAHDEAKDWIIPKQKQP